MTPAAIIERAAADGVRLALSHAGTIKAAGSGEAVNRWLPIIREHKAGLLDELRAANDSANMLPDPSSEARRQRKAAELARHMRTYADRNGFSEADVTEAMAVAMAGDTDAWCFYLQNETRH